MSSKKKILLVEDDQFLSRIYTEAFEAEGFEVVAVATGEDALRVAKKDLPNLIMLDIILPKMDGFETLEQLKQEAITAGVPVIIMSNLGQKEDIERGIKLGAVSYIIKAHTSRKETLAAIRRAMI